MKFDPSKEYGLCYESAGIYTAEDAKIALEDEARKIVPEEYMRFVKYGVRRNTLVMGDPIYIYWRYPRDINGVQQCRP